MASQPTVGVVTWRLRGEKAIGTQLLVSRHGLVTLGSRLEKGCRDQQAGMGAQRAATLESFLKNKTSCPTSDRRGFFKQFIL